MVSPCSDRGSGAPNPGSEQPAATVTATATAAGRHAPRGRRTAATVADLLRFVVACRGARFGGGQARLGPMMVPRNTPASPPTPSHTPNAGLGAPDPLNTTQSAAAWAAAASSTREPATPRRPSSDPSTAARPTAATSTIQMTSVYSSR